MEFIIFEYNKQQFFISKDQLILVPGILEKEDTIDCDKVILQYDKGIISIGNPYIKNKTIKLKVSSSNKKTKVRVSRYKAKSRYRKTKGTLTHYHVLQIA